MSQRAKKKKTGGEPKSPRSQQSSAKQTNKSLKDEEAKREAELAEMQRQLSQKSAVKEDGKEM